MLARSNGKLYDERIDAVKVFKADVMGIASLVGHGNIDVAVALQFLDILVAIRGWV